MLKLDFNNNEYTLEEIILAITDGDIGNFKGDNDFLDFLLAYTLGEYIYEGEDYKYKEYVNHHGVWNLMQLDDYGYFGEKLYKIYEICEKDKLKFIESIKLIGMYTIGSILDKKSVDLNLSLKNPVWFVSQPIVLSAGRIPKFNLKANDQYFSYDLNDFERTEYIHELKKSFRHRINERIIRDGESKELLEENPVLNEINLLKLKEYLEIIIEQKYMSIDEIIQNNKLFLQLLKTITNIFYLDMGDNFDDSPKPGSI